MWMSGKSELELIDSILRTRSYVQTIRVEGETVPAEIISKLKRLIETIVEKLPSDLKELVRNGSPVL